MNPGAIPAIISSLSGDAIGLFVLAVIIDDFLGVLDAVLGHTFDPKKLPSFLASQFATKQGLAVLGLVLTAYVTGGDAHQAALAAVTAGGSAMTLSVLADIYSKLKGLIAPPAPSVKSAACFTVNSSPPLTWMYVRSAGMS